MIATTITIGDEGDYLRALFAAEEHRLLNDRASYALARKGDATVITAKAKDASALRAMLNSICKILIIYEKTTKVVNDG